MTHTFREFLGSYFPWDQPSPTNLHPNLPPTFPACFDFLVAGSQASEALNLSPPIGWEPAAAILGNPSEIFGPKKKRFSAVREISMVLLPLRLRKGADFMEFVVALHEVIWNKKEKSIL